VDDDPVIVELITTALSGHGYSIECAPDAQEALRLIRHDLPDVVLLDVRLPDLSGYQVCRTLREDFGDGVGIMFISGERTDALDRAAGLLLDADDYLNKPFEVEELLARVHRLARRARPISRTSLAGLTHREHEVLRLMARGLDHLTIARDLVIAPKTVEKHIEHILLKLGVHSRAQAVALAFNDETIDEANDPKLIDLASVSSEVRRRA